MNSIPVNKVRAFEAEFLEVMERKHKDTLDSLGAGKFDDTITATLEQVCKELAANYTA